MARSAAAPGRTGPASQPQRVLRAVNGFQQRHRVTAVAYGVVRKFGDDQAGNQGALFAYYGLFSLFPLLLVFVTVLGFVLRGNAALERRVVHSALSQIPVIGSEIHVHALRGSGVALVIGIAGTLGGGLGITQQAQNAMQTIWAVPMRQRPNFVTRLVRGVGLLAVLGFGLLASTLVVGLATSQVGGVWARVAGIVLGVAINLGLVLLGFKVLGSAEAGWRSLLPGALLTAGGWAILQIVGGYYVTHQLRSASNTYGTFAIVIGLLSWLYLGAELLLYSAELNVVLARGLWPRSLVQDEPTPADRAVLVQLAKTEERRSWQTVDVWFADPTPGEPRPGNTAPAGAGGTRPPRATDESWAGGPGEAAP